MSAKHTPGPWSIHPHMGGENITDCEPSFTAHTAYIGAGDVLIGEAVAYCPGPAYDHGGYKRTTNFDENKANARLIAAAPDLLEALRNYAEEVQPWTDSERKAIALAAIAKATGE